MESFRQLLARFSLFLGRLKSWQKVSLFGAAFGVIVLLLAAVFLAGRTSYEPIRNGLDIADQAKIVTYLRENGIQYHLNEADQSILVPRDQVAEIRLSLAAIGLPQGASKGKEEIFQETPMGRSEFDQRVSYVRAIEGELERTISLIDVVEKAKVSVIIPKPALFLEDQQPSTASILVLLKAGMQINSNQIKAIINLASKSVDGLLPENVTLVDGSGRILSDMIADELIIYPLDGSEPQSLQRQLERRQEQELEAKVRSALAFLGPNKALVKIKVDLNFHKRKVVEKEFIPNPETGRGVLRSQTNAEETWSGTGPRPPQAPGTTTNIPGYPVYTEPGDSEYNKTDGVNNYDITTRESEEVLVPGNIRRLTASVVVDGEWDEVQLAKVRETVQGAVGFDEARGDRLAVNSWIFDDSLVRELAEQLRRDRMVRITEGTLTVLFVLLCVALAAYWWWRKRKARMALDSMQKETKRVPTIQEMLTSPDLLAFQGEMAVLEEQLKAYARNNPDEVANLVNEWISVEA